MGTAGGFVAKLDSNGTVLWAKPSGAPGRSIAIDASGSIYTVGSFQGTVSFGSSSSPRVSAGGHDVVLIKYDASGDVLWAKAAGGASDDIGRGVAVDTSGSSYVTGEFRGTANFGATNLTCAGKIEVFLAKYNSSGNSIWAVQGNGSGKNIVLSWPANINGLVLEATESLTSPAWTALASVPRVGDKYSLNIGISARNMFFRLRKQ